MKRISLALLLFFSATVMAEESPHTAESLAKINEQVAILTARLKALELQLQIDTKQAEISKLSGSTISDETAIPILKSIEGVDGNMYANFVYSDGGKISVEKGDSLPSGWVVESIGIKSVILSKEKKKIRLSLRMPQSAKTSTSPAGH